VEPPAGTAATLRIALGQVAGWCGLRLRRAMRG
jgi:hypothetical protein